MVNRWGIPKEVEEFVKKRDFSLEAILQFAIPSVFIAEFHLLIRLLLIRQDQRGNTLLTTLELTDQTTLRFAVDHAMQVRG